MDVFFTPQRIIPTPGGDVLHGMKLSDPGFAGFGEAYFSKIESGYVKGWKRHRLMTLNFVVPTGRIQVSVCDERGASSSFLLSPERSETHGRLTIAPGLWVAFGGASKQTSVMMNLANLPHDPAESEICSLDAFPWSWREWQ